MPAEPMAEPPMSQEPPMPYNMGNEAPPMDNGMDDMDGNGGNPFDTNFDAGVEANEETDPKKYIQQLTGKLSQSLRSYNETLPQPDADLDKYVAGMVVKQAVEGLSPEDTEEILKKVKGDETEEAPEQPQTEMPQQDTEQPLPDEGMDGGGEMGMGESIVKENKKKIDEIFNQLINNDSEEDQISEPIDNIGYHRKPFTSPHFI